MTEDLINQFKKAKKHGDRNFIAGKILKVTRKGAEHLVIPIVHLLQKEKHYIVRETLRKILVQVGTDTAVEAIKDTINDESDYIAEYTVSNLEKVKTPAAYQAIKEILLSNKNPKIRSRAFVSIRNSISYYNHDTHDFLIDAFTKALNTETELSLSKSIINSLSSLWDKTHNQKFIDLILDISKNHKNMTIRKTAEEIINKIDDEEKIQDQGYELVSGKLTITKLSDGSLNSLNLNGKESEVSVLKISNIKDLTHLKGIEKFQNLVSLTVNKTSLSDLSNISSLQKLDGLMLSQNNIKNIKPISNFPKLTGLYLSENLIEKIEGLINLPYLSSLSLSKNKITELSGLSHLLSLEYLRLGNNQITDIKGIEKFVYLIYLDLRENPLQSPIGLLKGDYALRFIAKRAGITITALEKKSNIRPFYNARLRFNVEDRCLYCKQNVSTGQNYQTNCEEQFREMINIKNDKIPDKITEKVIIKRATSKQVHGYKDTPFSPGTSTTYTVSTRAETEKRKKYLKKIIGIFYTLAGTVCKDCSDKFLSEAKAILKSVKTKGKPDVIIKSVDEAIKNLKSLIDTWIAKVKQ